MVQCGIIMKFLKINLPLSMFKVSELDQQYFSVRATIVRPMNNFENFVYLQVCIQKYHTLFLSISGNVWCCGLGKGGRLGLSSEDTILIPQKVALTPSSSQEEKLFCKNTAVGADHSVFWCGDNQVKISNYIAVTENQKKVSESSEEDLREIGRKFKDREEIVRMFVEAFFENLQKFERNKTRNVILRSDFTN